MSCACVAADREDSHRRATHVTAEELSALMVPSIWLSSGLLEGVQVACAGVLGGPLGPSWNVTVVAGCLRRRSGLEPRRLGLPTGSLWPNGWHGSRGCSSKHLRWQKTGACCTLPCVVCVCVHGVLFSLMRDIRFLLFRLRGVSGGVAMTSSPRLHVLWCRTLFHIVLSVRVLRVDFVGRCGLRRRSVS